uniref:Uncharacterized protein n=1 Tax=Anguilla anguilla TaxID=7936 RepID=A0A0E9VIH7_ANGAN
MLQVACPMSNLNFNAKCAINK